MQKVPHERLALVKTEMVVIFFANQWSGWKFLGTVHYYFIGGQLSSDQQKGRPGFYMVPMAWPDEGKAALRKLSSEDLRLVKIEQQKVVRESVQKARERRRNPAQGDLFNERQES